jgi:hypothetical protein
MSRRRRLPFNGFSLVINGTLNSQATFTRASAGTYFDSNGVMQTAADNEARNHYLQDGSDLNGLLIEGGRTNLLLYSGAPDTSGTWSGFGNWSDDGTETALDGVSAAKYVAFPDATEVRVYDASNAAFIVATAITVTTTKTKVSATFTTPVGCTSIRCYSYRVSVGAPNGYQTITVTPETKYTYSFYVWRNAGSTRYYYDGGQLEQAGFSSSYIPTTAIAAARAADVATIDLTAASWFDAVDGTVFADFMYLGAPNTASGRRVFELSNGASTVERLSIGIVAGGALAAFAVTSSSTVASLSLDATPAADIQYKAAFAYKVNDFAASLDGGAAVTDTSGAVPAVTQFNIGRSGTGSLDFFGIINTLKYWGGRKPNAYLESITT